MHAENDENKTKTDENSYPRGRGRVSSQMKETENESESETSSPRGSKNIISYHEFRRYNYRVSLSEPTRIALLKQNNLQFL